MDLRSKTRWKEISGSGVSSDCLFTEHLVKWGSRDGFRLGRVVHRGVLSSDAND